MVAGIGALPSSIGAVQSGGGSEYYNVGSCRRGDVDCPLLRKAIERIDISQVKHISARLNLNYLELLYGGEPYEKAIYRAKAFLDLEGCKAILNQYNKLYPQDLYSDMSTKAQINLAMELKDLPGLKYIYRNDEGSYLSLYNQTKFPNQAMAMQYAIELGDIDAVKQINVSLRQKELSVFIKYAYYDGFFEIASYLIEKNIAKFNLDDMLTNIVIPGLARAAPIYEYNVYHEHLEVIDAFFTKNQMSIIHSLIDTMFDRGKINLTNSLVKHPLLSDTTADIGEHLDILELGSLKGLHHTVAEVLSVISINSVSANNIDILLPSTGTHSFFHLLNTDEPYKHHFIHVPLAQKNFKPALIHELSHAMFLIIFENELKPYMESNTDMYNSHNMAVNNTITNVITNITNGKHSYYNKDVKLIFWLNHWQISGEDASLTNKLFTSLKSKGGEYSLSYKRELLSSLYQEKTLKWGKDTAIVVERVFEYLQRPSDEKPVEFLVRLPELYVSGIGDAALSLLKPALEYWEKYVTPQVQNYIKEHYIFCKSLIKDDISSCILPVLSSKQHEELLVWAAENSSIELVKALSSDVEIMNNMDEGVKKIAIATAASKIGSCVKYCNDKLTKCYYIPPVNFFERVKHSFGDWLYECSTVKEDPDDNGVYHNMLNILGKNYLVDDQLVSDQLASIEL